MSAELCGCVYCHYIRSLPVSSAFSSPDRLKMCIFVLTSYVLLHGDPLFFFFNDTATTEIYTLSLHDALPISVHGPSEMDKLVKAMDNLWSQCALNRAELTA